jgi:hypothetical protein
MALSSASSMRRPAQRWRSLTLGIGNLGRRIDRHGHDATTA